MPRSVTSSDVARHLGVSQATVSLALSDTSGSRVSERTRVRVREAANALGYHPSRTARALRTGRTDTVVLLTPDTPGAIGYLAVGDLVDKLGAAGFELVIHRLRPDEPLASLWSGQVPAAIIGSQMPSIEELDSMRSAGVTPLFVDMVAVSRRIGRTQVHHLHDRGRRTIAYVGPGDLRDHPFVSARIEGAADACREFNLVDLVVADIELDQAPAEKAIAALHGAGVDGVAAYNDDHAFAVLSGARSVEVRVPDQLAVVGADDVPLGRVADPPLTTVKVGASGLTSGVSSLRMHQPDADLAVDLTLIPRSSS